MQSERANPDRMSIQSRSSMHDALSTQTFARDHDSTSFPTPLMTPNISSEQFLFANMADAFKQIAPNQSTADFSESIVLNEG